MKVTIICITSPDSMKVFFRLVNKKKKCLPVSSFSLLSSCLSHCPIVNSDS